MTGFDDGTLQSGVQARAKQFGSILRGYGPPVPQAGVIGDLYVDVQTFFLYGKRDAESTDPWGHPLFQVPLVYQSTLKWFSASLPPDSVGVDGDYCLLWSGYNNYGMLPSVYGPKDGDNWPESGNGPNLLLDPAYAGYTLPCGLVDEGSPVAFSSSSQLVVVGLDSEYILAIPVAQIPNSLVMEEGLQSTPSLIIGVISDPLYAATDQHVV